MLRYAGLRGIGMREDKTTMSDIAKALNISTISVSRALSGHDGVSGELRNRILQKASELRYFRPKAEKAARVLVLHRKPYVQDNSNYSIMIQDMEQALQEAGCEYDLEFVDKGLQGEQQDMPRKIARGTAYDGVVWVGRFDAGYRKRVMKGNRNCVLYAGYVPSADCDSVWYNFNNAGYQLCEFLIRQGHRKIGYLGCADGYVSREKTLGIAAALEDHGLAADRGLFVCGNGDAEQRILELVRSGQGPTAVICQGDYTAAKLIQFLFEKGVRVPGDLSVVGGGNTEMSSLCIPALTTMEMHIGYACRAAADLLRKRLAEPEKPAESILVGGTLVERDSVRPLL